MLKQISEIGVNASEKTAAPVVMQTPRTPTNSRPVLRVATEQQFLQISPLARVLILQVEISQGITFQRRPQARKAAFDLCRALASVLIARGC